MARTYHGTSHRHGDQRRLAYIRMRASRNLVASAKAAADSEGVTLSLWLERLIEASLGHSPDGGAARGRDIS